MPTFGDTLLRFSAGFENPAGAFAQQQKTQNEQQQRQFAAAQLILENTAQDNPARAKAIEMIESVQPGLGATMGQGLFKAAEKFNLGPGTVRFQEQPGGAPPKEIARGVPQRAAASQTVNVDTKQRGKTVQDELKAVISAGRFAAQRLPRFQQLSDLMSSQDLQTGSLQPAFTSLQGVAEDLGIDSQAVAQKLGINIGKLSTKQDFNRVSRQILIDSFEDFKGNLNASEVQIAEDSVGSLGLSEDANIEAIAAGTAAAQLARERSELAIYSASGAEDRAILGRLLGDDVEEFMTRKDKIADQIRKARQGPQEGLSKPRLERPLGVPRDAELMGQTQTRIFQTPDGRFFRE